MYILLLVIVLLRTVLDDVCLQKDDLIKIKITMS